MDYNLKKEVLNLRKFLFDEFFEIQREDEEYLAEDKMVSIDSIIALLSTYDYTLDKAEDELREIDEMSYYDLDELSDLKDETLKQANEVKKEIIKEFYNSKYNSNIKDLVYEVDDNKEHELKYTKQLRGKTKTISRECSNLKELLESENYIPESLNNLSISIENMYEKIEEIFGNLQIDDEYFDDDDDEFIDDEDDDIEELDEELDDDNEDEWTNTSMFNYDIALIDSIYLTIFSEIEEQQRVLIKLMLADFYEYHKVNKLFEFKEEENIDVIDTLNFIETSSVNENIQRFLDEPIWAEYVIDSYIYYNLNNTAHDKLCNRMAICELNKLNVLKKYNQYIDDSLKDETLYNIFITPISDLIRTANCNLTFILEENNKRDVDKLLTKYFTTSFLPNNDDYIPEPLKKARINDLKKLQLKFLISDFLERHIHENDEFINSLLNMNEEDLYNYVKSNPLILNGIAKEYLRSEETEINLNDKEKKKILSINKLTMLDT